MPTRIPGAQPEGPRPTDAAPRINGFAFYFFIGSLLLGILGLIGYAFTL